VLLGKDNFDILHADGAKGGSNEFSGTPHIGGVFRCSTDAGDADELFQFIEQARTIGFHESVGGL